MSITSLELFSGFPLPYPSRVTVETPDGGFRREAEKVPIIGAVLLRDLMAPRRPGTPQGVGLGGL